MKKWFVLVFIFTFLITACGCNLREEPIATPDDFVEQDETNPSTSDDKNTDSEKHLVSNPENLTAGEQPTIHFESVEKNETDTVTFYYDQDISGLTEFGDPLTEYADPPQTYSQLLHLIGKDGLIVAGTATGIREGRRSATKTITEFDVQKVCYGNLNEKRIKICEKFVVISDEGRNFINYQGNKYTKLKDQQPVLLFLTPSEWLDGAYEPVYYEIPLPSDYLDYDEDYLDRFLDYYRGERTAYQYPEQYTETVEVVQPDGSILQIHKNHGGNYWTKQDVSNEELIEKMKEHILVQSVVEFKIKIWPIDHVEYQTPLSGVSEIGIQEVSYPE